MKKFVIVILVIITFAFLTLPLTAGKPQTQQGSKCILYGFNGLSNLSIDNSRLGFQYLFADKMGVWAGISLSFLTEKPYQGANDNITNDIDFDIGFIYYLFQKGPVAFWISPKIGIGFGSNEYKDGDSPKVDVSSNQFDVGFQIGVEWWFTDYVSLSLETDFGFLSKSKTIESESSKIESSQTRLGILSESGPNFVILFYF